MATVKFTDAAEFVEELRKDLDLVERGIVRLTIRARPAREVDLPDLRHVSVVATALVEGRFVRLDRSCGETWGLDQDKQVLELAEEVQRLIEEFCQETGLKVRGGVYE
jgi:hypothetical protein